MADNSDDPCDPVVREALEREIRIAHDALAPMLDAAVARGLSREEAVAIASRAIKDGGPDGVLDRVTAALEAATKGER